METEQIFNYKRKDIFIKKKGRQFQIGIGNPNMIIWLEKALYNDFKIATSSGVEYARIFIDRLLISEKRSSYEETN